MAESFGEQLRHRPGQNEVIRDPVKAEAMANRENRFQNLAALYEKYLEDPARFAETDPDWGLWKRYIGSLDDVGISGLPSDDPARKFKKEIYQGRDFEALAKEGITPADLRMVGDRFAESQGEIYDFGQEARHAFDLQLTYNPLTWRLISLIHSLRSVLTPREYAAGMALSPEKFERQQKAAEARHKAEILERELVARAADKLGDHERAEKIRDTRLE